MDENKTQDPVTEQPAATPATKARNPLSGLWKIALLNTLVLCGIAGALLVPRGSAPTVATNPPAAAPHGGAPALGPASASAAHVAEPATPPAGLSWRAAEEDLAAGNDSAALAKLTRLADVAEAGGANPVSDYLRLRMGQCCRRLGDIVQSRRWLGRAAESLSPAVRCLANYELARLDLAQGHATNARMRAYMSLAAAGSSPELAATRMDCEFLVGAALARRTLGLYGDEASMPSLPLNAPDALAGLEEPALRARLQAGVKQAASAATGPQLARVDGGSSRPQWSATAVASPLEDLLASMGGTWEFDVRWEGVEPPVRRRAVTMQMTDDSIQRICEVAAGAAGLVGRFHGETFCVRDGDSENSQHAQRSALAEETAAYWRGLLLRYPRDGRTGIGHLAVGLILEHAGAASDALSEYRLVEQRFGNTPAAPAAMLRIARVHLGLRDHAACRNDLTALLDRYPACSEAGEACATLGEAELAVGNYAVAAGLFKRLYFQDVSDELKARGALGAGESLYRQKVWEEGADWLNRFLAKAPGDDRRRAAAHGMLGSCYIRLGRGRQATAALNAALAGQTDRRQRAELYECLAQAYLDSNDLVHALSAVEAADATGLSDDVRCRLRVLHARVFRRMNLPERAQSLLKNALRTETNPACQGAMAVELAGAHRDADEPEAARAVLTEALPKLPPGPAAQEAMCDLAELSLRLARPDEAATLAREVLKLKAAAALNRRAAAVLAAAQMARKEYEQSALTASGAAGQGGGQ